MLHSVSLAASLYYARRADKRHILLVLFFYATRKNPSRPSSGSAYVLPNRVAEEQEKGISWDDTAAAAATASPPQTFARRSHKAHFFLNLFFHSFLPSVSLRLLEKWKGTVQRMSSTTVFPPPRWYYTPVCLRVTAPRTSAFFSIVSFMSLISRRILGKWKGTTERIKTTSIAFNSIYTDAYTYLFSKRVSQSVNQLVT